MIKRIGFARPFPFPLTFVLYIPDSLYNLVFISKLTQNLTVLLPFLIHLTSCRTRIQERPLTLAVANLKFYFG